MCPGLVSVAVINTITERNLIRRKFILNRGYSLWIMNREETPGQELKERPRKNTADWFALSACRMQPRSTYPGMAQPRIDLVYLQQPASRRMPWRQGHKQIWWKKCPTEIQNIICRIINNKNVLILLSCIYALWQWDM